MTENEILSLLEGKWYSEIADEDFQIKEGKHKSGIINNELWNGSKIEVKYDNKTSRWLLNIPAVHINWEYIEDINKDYFSIRSFNSEEMAELYKRKEKEEKINIESTGGTICRFIRRK